MFNSSRNAALHPNQGHAADALFVCGIPGRHANKHTHPQTDTHIWDALVKLACLQQQNHNSVVGYYEWEWAGFFRCGASNTSSLTCFPAHKHTWRVSTLHTHTHTRSCAHKHWKAWHWYQLGRKSLKCPSQALWSALAVITWWWMGRWRNETEKKGPCSLLLPLPSPSLSPPLSVCRSLCVFVALSACSCRSQGVREREDEKGGRGGGRGLWSSVHTSLKTTPADID